MLKKISANILFLAMDLGYLLILTGAFNHAQATSKTKRIPSRKMRVLRQTDKANI